MSLKTSMIAALISSVLIPAAAEARILSATHYGPTQSGPSGGPLLLKAGSNSAFFSLGSAGKVSFTVSGFCAVAIDTFPNHSVTMYLKIQIDGTTALQSQGIPFCSGNDSSILDGGLMSSFTFAKSPGKGSHSIQIIANPYSNVDINPIFNITNLSVVAQY